MNEDIAGKKLLILGSTPLIARIVKKAKEMGVYTVVTDNRPIDNAPAKQIADEYRNISFSDYEAIKALIKELNIDGVLTGFTDSYMEHYLRICKDNHLPCYGDAATFAIATDKVAFKEACNNSKVPVIPGGKVCDFDSASKLATKIGYPIFLKPADNSGSRGAIKCESFNMLKKAFDYAMSFSNSKTVILEKYMDCENVAAAYFIADGEIKLSSTNDRYLYISPESGSSITSYAEYPSKYTDRYLDEVDGCVRRMLHDNGFRDGMLSVQAFVDDKSFYFCEMCFRPSGGHHFYFIKDQNNIDQLGLLIRYALLGSCHEQWTPEMETPFFKEPCAMLKIIGKPNQKVIAFSGIKDVCKRPDVICAYESHRAGECIGQSATTAQVVATVWYKEDSIDKLRKCAKDILDLFHIEYEDGGNELWISLPEKHARRS